jgi:drug/metabolite transporter (DMT)-like permease
MSPPSCFSACASPQRLRHWGFCTLQVRAVPVRGADGWVESSPADFYIWVIFFKSGFITGLYIVLVPLASAIVYKKAPQLSEVLGTAIATTGLGLMTLTGRTFEVGTGDLLTMGCAVAFTFHIMVLGYYSQRMGYEWLTLLQIGTCAAIALVSFWWVETPVVRWNAQVAIALGVTSLLGTALGFTVQTWAQQYTTPTRTALIFALEPVFAWITSFILNNEVLSRRAAIGAIFILAGILLVELKPIGRRPHQDA